MESGSAHPPQEAHPLLCFLHQGRSVGVVGDVPPSRNLVVITTFTALSLIKRGVWLGLDLHNHYFCLVDIQDQVVHPAPVL